MKDALEITLLSLLIHFADSTASNVYIREENARFLSCPANQTVKHAFAILLNGMDVARCSVDSGNAFDCLSNDGFDLVRNSSGFFLFISSVDPWQLQYIQCRYDDIVLSFKINIIVTPFNATCDKPEVKDTLFVSIKCSTLKVWPPAVCIFNVVNKNQAIAGDVVYNHTATDNPHYYKTVCSLESPLPFFKDRSVKFDVIIFPNSTNYSIFGVRLEANSTIELKDPDSAHADSETDEVWKIVVGVSVPVIAIVVICVLSYFVKRYRSKNGKPCCCLSCPNNRSPDNEIQDTDDPTYVDISDIQEQGNENRDQFYTDNSMYSVDTFSEFEEDPESSYVNIGDTAHTYNNGTNDGNTAITPQLLEEVQEREEEEEEEEEGTTYV